MFDRRIYQNTTYIIITYHAKRNYNVLNVKQLTSSDKRKVENIVNPSWEKETESETGKWTERENEDISEGHSPDFTIPVDL